MNNSPKGSSETGESQKSIEATDILSSKERNSLIGLLSDIESLEILIQHYFELILFCDEKNFSFERSILFNKIRYPMPSSVKKQINPVGLAGDGSLFLLLKSLFEKANKELEDELVGFLTGKIDGGEQISEKFISNLPVYEREKIEHTLINVIYLKGIVKNYISKMDDFKKKGINFDRNIKFDAIREPLSSGENTILNIDDERCPIGIATGVLDIIILFERANLEIAGYI